LREHVIIDSAINLSDHLPVKIVCRIGVAINSDNVAGLSNARPNFKNNFALLDWNKDSNQVHCIMSSLELG